jgi:hypothetical protein
MTTNDVAMVFDTLLSVPGMNDVVKIDLKVSRKNILLLNQVIQRGLSGKEEEKLNLLGGISKESLQELKDLSQECLLKAGLEEFNEKLNALHAK